MRNIKFKRKYFVHEDKLRVVISILSGILIITFNAASGFLITHFIIELLSGIDNIFTGKWKFFLYFVASIILGSLVLIACNLLLEFMLKKIDVEDFSFLRLLLLFSIAAYLLIIIIYSLFSIINTISAYHLF